MKRHPESSLFNRLYAKLRMTRNPTGSPPSGSNPASKPTQTPASSIEPPMSESDANLTSACEDRQPDQSPHKKPPYPHHDKAVVTINTEIPHGSKLTITIEADKQGEVHVDQQHTNAQSAGIQRHTKKPRPQKRAAQAGVVKNSLSWFIHLPERISQSSLAHVAILRNGLIFCILGILAATVADNELRNTRAYTSTALLPLLLAGLLFAWGTWAVHLNGGGILKDAPRKRLFSVNENKPPRTVPFFLIGSALLLSYWVSVDSVSGDSYHPAWLLSRWGLAILLVCVAFWQLQAKPENKNAGKKGNGWLIIGLVVIVLVGFGLRVWQLSSIPYTLGGDEGEQGVETLRVLNGDLTNPFVSGWYGVPTFSFFFTAPAVALFGNTIFGLRITWALVGTVSILVTYLLVKELKGKRLALIVTVLVTTFHYHIHFSRLGSNQISDTLLVGLTLLFLMRGYLRGKLFDWGLAGVMAGIAQYFYAGGRLAVILVVFLVTFFFIRDGFKMSRVNFVGLIIFLVALLVVGGPMFSYAIHFPDDYSSRANQVGIIQSGWLEREALILGVSRAETMFDQFKRATLAFNAYPDRIAWYLLPGPLLDRVSGILFIPSLIAASFWSLRDRRLAPMVAWWWGGVLSGGMLTLSTPQSQRLITTSIPTMFFVAFAIKQTSTAIKQQIHQRAGLAFSLLSILLISAISIHLYFVEFSPNRLYGGPHALIGTNISEKVLNDPGPEPDIYFFGAPRMYAGIGTMRYLIPEVTKVDIREPLSAGFVPDPPPEAETLWFIFLPERLDELEYVQQTFSGGHLEAVRSVVDPEFIHYFLYSFR